MRATALTVGVMTIAVSTASAASLTQRASVRLGTTTIQARASAAPVRAMMLGGLSSKGWPAVIAMSKDLRRIRYAAIGLDLSCSAGSGFAVSGWLSEIPVGANGKVQTMQAISPQAGSAGSASLTGGSESLSGKLNRAHLTFAGTWRLLLNFSLPNNQSAKCDSGQVSFTARL